MARLCGHKGAQSSIEEEVEKEERVSMMVKAITIMVMNIRFIPAPVRRLQQMQMRRLQQMQA